MAFLQSHMINMSTLLLSFSNQYRLPMYSNSIAKDYSKMTMGVVITRLGKVDNEVSE